MTLRGVIVSFILTIVLSIMVLGYAALQQKIDIEGEATVDSTYKVQINSVREKSATGDARSTSVFQYNGLSTTFHVGLTNETDSITYEIELNNLGTVDAILNNTEMLIDGSNNIKVVKSGIRNGDILLANSLKILTITVKLIEATSNEQTANITINLDYTRLKGGTGDVINEEGLPTGYKTCEYIESTGTQYIDTKILTNSELKVIIDMEVMDIESTQFYFGGRQGVGSKSFALLNFTRRFRSDFNLNMYFTTSSTIGNLDGYPLFNIIMDKNSIIINNMYSESTSYESFETNTNFYLFAINTNGIPDNRMAKIKLYSFKIYDNNLLKLDFIPALDNNNVPCLYDTVSGETFYNQGTGDFLYKLKE